MSPWVVALLVVLALGLGWALARARYAERALLDAQRRPRESDPPLRSAPALVAGSAGHLPEPVRPADAIVVGSDANPVAVVRRASDMPRVRLQALSLPAATSRSLQPLLAQAPRVLMAGSELASGLTKVVVTFTPDVARGLATGAYEMMPVAGGAGVRAIARTAGGAKEIVGHGSLTTNVNPVAIAGAVWQVAAIVTAQKFLADINARLANVELGIAAIQSFLEDGVHAQLQTSAVRLREMADAVRDQRLSPRELDTLAHEIESIDREAHQITELYARQLARVPAEIGSQVWDATWSTEDAVAEAHGAIAKAAAQSAVYFTSLEVRVLSNTIRGAFGMESRLAEQRIEQVALDLNRHAASLSAVYAAVVAKLPTLKASLQFDTTDATHQAMVQGALQQAIQVRHEEWQALKGTVAMVDSLIRDNAADLASPQELELDVAPDGSILSAARRLPAHA